MHAFLVDAVALHPQMAGHLEYPCCGMAEEVPVHLPHKYQVHFALLFGHVVQAAALLPGELEKSVPIYACWTLLLQLPHFTFSTASSQASAKKHIPASVAPLFCPADPSRLSPFSAPSRLPAHSRMPARHW